MATINLSDPSNGTTADAALIANNNALLEALLNGGLDNANINASAAIAYAKLALTAAIVNADIAAAAAIAVSKLAAGTNGHVLTTTAGVPTWAAPASTGTTKAGNYTMAANPLANNTAYEETVSFGYTFGSTPIVVASVKSNTQGAVHANIYLISPNTTGFQLGVYNVVNSNSVVVSWIAFLA